MKRFGWFALVLFALYACNSQSPVKISEEDVALNNRGVGLMGQFNYGEAHDVFAQLLEKFPKHPLFATNLAIATLNRQKTGDEQTALDILAKVLEAHPGDQAAHYCSGLLHVYLGNEEAAYTHFLAVKNDAYALYHLGQILANRGDVEGALAKYKAVLEMDPYLRSAYYGAFRAYQQAGDADQARQMLGDFQRLKDNPRAHLFEIKYTRMGPLAEVRTLGRKPLEPVHAEGPLFTSAVVHGEGGAPWQAPDGTPSLTAVDFDGDGHLDVFQPEAMTGDSGPVNVVWMGDGTGQFKARTDHPLQSAAKINAVLWGDYDNDGLVDVYFCKSGPNQMWRQKAPGEWEDVTASTATANGNQETVNGALFDADHDGDLDLFLVNGDGPNALLNNNRDGSFTDIAPAQGLDGGNRASRSVVTGDFDGDRDADIFVIHNQPPHQVFINDRLWNYRPDARFKALEQASVQAAFLTDLDASGNFSMVTLSSQGVVRNWHPDGAGNWQGTDLFTLSKSSGQNAVFADISGNGRSELICATSEGLSILTLGDSPQESSTAGPSLTSLLPLAGQPSKGYSIAGIDAKGQLVTYPPGPGRAPSLALSFSGKEDTGQAMRSNASGIGTEVAIRAGRHWTIGHNYPVMAAPGQSLQPLILGIGGSGQADFMALEWSDGVYQTELGLEGAKAHAITETQRQLSSCPVIFTWDGETHRFVSDVLGVAGIGFAHGDGTYSNPRPWEHFLMPPNLAKPKEGRYQIKITEPMEEAAYIDQAKLTRYELPEGWDMVIDERMNVAGPEPTGNPIYYRHELRPTKAVNDRGEAVTAQLAQADFVAAPTGPRDHRFLGRLENRHQLTLEFGQPINPAQSQPVLMADGWVEYPYSQTMFAAWQAKAAYEAPTLEARDADGRWHTIYDQFGYPAGMPRRMALPLPDLPEGTDALRLTTNLEIYWDRIAIAYAEACPEVRVLDQPLELARLARTGFQKRTTGKQMLPHYEYASRAPLWDTRYMSGYYTREGDVLALVQTGDDALAIIGPGEEIHLEFSASGQGADTNTRLVFEINGWCKDMDLFTKDGETLGPLPSSGHSQVSRKRLHSEYNTRYHSGR